MDTRKLIPAEQLQHSQIFMGELYRKMSYLPYLDTVIDDYYNKSKTVYLILNQKRWKNNDCTLYLQMSDGQEHNRLEMEQPFNMTLECWRFSIEAYYKRDTDGKEILIVNPTKIIIQEVSDVEIEFTHSASESEYLQKIEAERQAIEDANKYIKKI